MTRITKTLVGTFAVGAMALASASPASAQHRRDRDNKVDAGDVIAGALIIGGIAAVLSSGKNNRRANDGYSYRDRNYRNTGDRYNNRRNNNRYASNNRRGEQRAIDKCIRAAERDLSRYSRGSRAEVIQIRDVDRKNHGFKVKGRIAVEEGRRNNRYGSRRNNGWDEGKFTCDVRRGRVVDVNFRGIRGI